MLLPTLLITTLFTLVSGDFPHTGTKPSPPTLTTDGAKTKHDYRFAVKKPFFLYKDKKEIPYFASFGNVLIGTDSIRLTPSVANMKGSLWSTLPNPHDEWMAEFSFSVTGKNYFGGKGFAFWYTKDGGPKTEALGEFMGHKAVWDGLAVVFDTSDMGENRYTPYIYGILNAEDKDMTKHQRDYNSVSSGGCFRDYRTSFSGSPIFVRVTYAKKQLKVEVDLRQNGQSYSECFKIDNLALPKGYYWGLSAATSSDQHTADDHDIFGLDVYQVNPPAKESTKEFPEVKMDESVQKHIQQAETFVDDIAHKAGNGKAESYLEGITPKTVQAFQESQMKIIESLDILHQKLGAGGNVQGATTGSSSSSSSSTSSGSSDLNPILTKLDTLTKSLDTLLNELRTSTEHLTTKLTTLSESIKDSKTQMNTDWNLVKTKLDKVDFKASETHSKTERILSTGTSSGSGLGAWGLVAVVFGGQMVAMILYGVWRGKRDDRSKKFI